MAHAISEYKQNGVQEISMRLLGHADERAALWGGVAPERLRAELKEFVGWPDAVLSHNEDGEYGHAAHAAVSAVVKSVFPLGWEVVFDGGNEVSTIEQREYLEITLPSAIRRKRREIFEKCYPSQQVLWNGAPRLMGWAFNRGAELFSRHRR